MKKEELKEELCECGCGKKKTECNCKGHKHDENCPKEHKCDCGCEHSHAECECTDEGHACGCGCHEHKGINCGYENPIDAILDPNCEENIILFDELDKPTEFEQIAIIPIENNVYAILKPVEKLEGLDEDAAIVFELVQDEDGCDNLQTVIDEKILEKVYEEYELLIAENAD